MGTTSTFTFSRQIYLYPQDPLVSSLNAVPPQGSGSNRSFPSTSEETHYKCSLLLLHGQQHPVTLSNVSLLKPGPASTIYKQRNELLSFNHLRSLLHNHTSWGFHLCPFLFSPYLIINPFQSELATLTLEKWSLFQSPVTFMPSCPVNTDWSSILLVPVKPKEWWAIPSFLAVPQTGVLLLGIHLLFALCPSLPISFSSIIHCKSLPYLGRIP